ncbi:Crp/Fnr family transcriptional regulator [Olivibacter sp. CPCC 100613]|uniref:Crp/Fnr family transcriptional regulator n=1 Tax=Olivibacter sp. CPCC 100613 TaxID=3079931 RepID=UPI002FFA732A
MHKKLIAFIQAYSLTSLTDKDITAIHKAFIPKKLRKRQFLLQEGEVCKCYGFIISGAVRQYTIDERGVEHTLSLAIENWWAGDRDSYFREQPSIYNIDACEETDLLLISREGLDRLLSIPAFVEMRIKLDENHSIASQKRLLSYISMNAEQRYADLLKSHPQFIERFPSRIIASYLGITKETLSRVRRYSKR